MEHESFDNELLLALGQCTVELQEEIILGLRNVPKEVEYWIYDPIGKYESAGGEDVSPGRLALAADTASLNGYMLTPWPNGGLQHLPPIAERKAR